MNKDSKQCDFSVNQRLNDTNEYKTKSIERERLSRYLQTAEEKFKYRIDGGNLSQQSKIIYTANNLTTITTFCFQTSLV